MLRKIKLLQLDKNSKGFTLIEAMVATAVFGIGFVGVYTVAATSEQIITKSIERTKTQMIADQILDIIETDFANIDSYAMNLATCVDPGASVNQYDIRGYEWCIRLQAELGDVMASDSRTITISTLADGRRVASILLEGHNEKIQIVMKRVFDD